MSKATQKALDCILFLKLYFLVRSSRVARHIIREHLEFVRKWKHQILLPEFGIELDVKKDFYVLRCIRLISQLHKKTGLKLRRQDDGGFLASIQGINLNFSKYEDIVLLSEIFLQHNYDIIVPYRSIVLDIGMNNADSTLYFASKTNVEHVRGYEPFEATYELAKRNIECNPRLAAKIELNNYGLSDKAAELECDYCSENTAGAGVSGILGKKGNVTKERIKLKSAANEVMRAIEDFPRCRMILKIDCEGSEFAIIESLERTHLLGRVDIILLEWHEKSPQVIIDTLQHSGFTIFNRDSLKGMAGMLYAFRQ